MVRKAAAQDDPEAMFQLGRMLMASDAYVGPDAFVGSVVYVRANLLIRKAAELGHNEAESYLAKVLTDTLERQVYRFCCALMWSL